MATDLGSPDGDGVREGAQPLAVLVCRRCGAPLAARDTDYVRCDSCGDEREVPVQHRQAVRLTKQADAELQGAARMWRSLERATLSPKRTLLFTHLPAALVTLGLTWLSISPPQAAPFPVPTVVVLGLIFLALPASVLGSVRASMYGIPPAQLVTMARSLVSRGEKHECRRCGAPLDVADRAVFARCIYCGTDSLVLLDARRERAHVAEVANAKRHAAEALQLIGARARETESISVAGAWAAGIASLTGFVACVTVGSLEGLRSVLALAFFISSLVTALFAWFIASSPHIMRQLRGTLQEALASRHGGRGAQSRPAVQLLVWGIAVSLLQVFAWFSFLFGDAPRVGSWLAGASAIPLVGWLLRALTPWEKAS
jgi:DNA-directed RNA polymerase subunit RPC12/RpoP